MSLPTSGDSGTAGGSQADLQEGEMGFHVSGNGVDIDRTTSPQIEFKIDHENAV